MKTTLMKLKEKAKTWLSPAHPFKTMELPQKRYYAAAVLLQTQLSESVSPVDHFELLRLLTFGLQLNREDVTEVIRLSRDKEKVLEMILSYMVTRSQQIVFLLDLCNVSYNGTNFGEKELQAVDIYGELFHLPINQITAIKRFMKNAVDNKVQECMQIFSSMMQIGMECSLENLRYYIPELEYTTVVDVTQLRSGQSIVLNGKCEIREEMIVPAGCNVRIHNAKISFHAPIVIKGGSLEIFDSELSYESGAFDVMISMTENGRIVMRKSNFYGGHYCGAVHQKEGTLDISQCEFYETNRRSAVFFSGKELLLTRSQFRECYVKGDGSAVHVEHGKGVISQCTFLHCMANRGGAIYAKSPMKISNCTFSKCHSHIFGNSIYYYGIAQGQVERCIYEDTLEARSQLIQDISDVKTGALPPKITCSTFVNIPMEYAENVSLTIQDAIIYLKEPMVCKGGLHLERVQMVAYDMEDVDMINVTNGRAVTMMDSQFDGREKNGILRATGTKVTIKDCIFTNSLHGRAIYNSVDLECENSVFNNCQDGAIYGTRAFIKSSQFVNCRSKHGAGIYLAGSKGSIKDCVFNRCVAAEEGGGISTSGNYRVTNCQYIECEPRMRE